MTDTPEVQNFLDTKVRDVLTGSGAVVQSLYSLTWNEFLSLHRKGEGELFQSKTIRRGEVVNTLHLPETVDCNIYAYGQFLINGANVAAGEQLAIDVVHNTLCISAIDLVNLGLEPQNVNPEDAAAPNQAVRYTCKGLRRPIRAEDDALLTRIMVTDVQTVLAYDLVVLRMLKSLMNMNDLSGLNRVLP